jgi:hypothetical protein
MWAHYPNATHRAHDMANITTSLRACLRSHTTSLPRALPTVRQPCFALHGEIGCQWRQQEVQIVPSRDYDHDQPQQWPRMGGGWFWCEAHLNRHVQRQASGEATYGPPQEASQGGMPKPRAPVRRRLKDCDVMRSFMTSGSLTWDRELDEGPNGSDMTPFPNENSVMMVYGGRPHRGGAACLA